MIKVNNLNKYYNKGRKNEQHVLNNINLEFENTGLVCILGESGSGKTTLLNTIGGLDDFADGTLQIKDTILIYLKKKKINVQNTYLICLVLANIKTNLSQSSQEDNSSVYQ